MEKEICGCNQPHLWLITKTTFVVDYKKNVVVYNVDVVDYNDKMRGVDFFDKLTGLY